MNQNDYLSHHGILNQKWGVRRFQNPDGTLTAEGRERYAKKYKSAERKRDRLTSTLEKRHRKTERYQEKVDRFAPSFAVRLIVGKKWRAKLATLRATKEYKLSRVRRKETATRKSLERFERKMKRKFSEIPLEEILDSDVDITWLKN